MLCENCGENEANVKYTQIINGVKKQMVLCDKCSKELGISNMDFNMPINLSSFLGEFFGDNEVSLPGFVKDNTLKCEECGMTYDEFIKAGKFGCANCYDTFSSRINPILKNLQGETTHIGRKTKVTKNTLDKEEIIKSEKEDKQKSELDILKEDLKKAIKEERYEDAAKIRDEIKKIENN
jgi:protein arginine kinase activator